MKEQRFSEKISDGLNGIGDDLIREAEDKAPVAMKKKHPWVKWAALAAAVLLIATAVPFVFLLSGGFGAKNAGSARNEAEYADVADSEKSGMAAPTISGKIGHDGVPEAAEDAEMVAPAPGSLKYGEAEPGDVTFDDGGDGEDETPSDEISIAPGQLTAAAWDDNLHFIKWRELFAADEQGNGNGRFAGFLKDDWGMPTGRRIVVRVTKDGAPVAGAKVYAAPGELTVQAGSAVTDATGTAYLFPTVESGTVTAVSSGEGVSAAFSAETGELAIELAEAEEKQDVIELMYVIDVTGSMGDELAYIARELDDVVTKVLAANPGTKILVSLLCYRDDEDAEKFTYDDFTDVTNPENLAAVQRILRGKDASGGGDYPEAVDEALELAVSKNWTDGAATKLIFHVLDAPAHETEAHKARYAAAVKKAAERGIRICPVLSSGADTLTEYLSRTEAVLTGGTFVFLTDDSGIGEGHLDPSLPEATREYLNALMIRLINGYHTGTFADPVAWYESK